MRTPNLIVLVIVGAILVIVIGIAIKGLDDSKATVTNNDVSQSDQSTSVPARAVDTSDIAKAADDIPSPITRTENELVSIELTTEELVAEIMPGVTYKYWTYNGTVPGPFIRAMEGDNVEITLHHGTGGGDHAELQVERFDTQAEAKAFMGVHRAYANGDDHMHDDSHAHEGNVEAQHDAEGHGTHSIDLHAVIGPGGGAEVMQVGHDGPQTFRFKATRPGIYVYHCASPHVPTHIANGMYGMILVEPEGGLPEVDKEFYVMQGDFYTKGDYGDEGHQEFDKEKLLSENPSYFVFNGRVGGLSGENAMRAQAGDTIRMFVGVGSHIASNFHIIGGIFDKLYTNGAITNEPLHNVQTTIIPAGGATMIEFTIDVPGTYLLVDHSLTRAIDKGALAELVIEGEARPDLYRGVDRSSAE